MEIFNEFKNKFIHEAIKCINKIYRGEELKYNMLRSLTEIEGIANYAVFSQPENDRVGLNIESDIPARPSQMEKYWLKSMLLSEKSKLFLTENERKALLEELKDIPDLSGYISAKSMAEHPDIIDDNFIEKFQTVMKAIREKRYISFDNETRNGIIHSEKMVVCKIEYSMSEEIFRVSMWRGDRLIKPNLGRMSGIRIGDSVPNEDFKYDSLSEKMESKKAKEPIVLCVDNKYQAIERASLLFSNFKRECVQHFESEDKPTDIQMTIEYYDFDEQTVIDKILSLGPMAKVISPEKIRSEIKAAIEKASAW